MARRTLNLTMWKMRLLPTIHPQQLTTLFPMKKGNISSVLRISSLHQPRKDVDSMRKLTMLEKRLSGYRDTVAAQCNHISKLDADRKAAETELKAKLWSA
jgi:hypothetical protein